MFIILQIFLYKAAFWETEGFLKAFKRQTNSVGVLSIVSLFKMFSPTNFNNLLEIPTKRANVNRKVRKLGNVTWGSGMFFGCIT